MNGRIVPWEESRIHVHTDAVLRGASVFEGLRAYKSAGGDDLLLFRVADHMHRLFCPSKCFFRLREQHTAAEVLQGTVEVLIAKQMRDHGPYRRGRSFRRL